MSVVFHPQTAVNAGVCPSTRAVLAERVPTTGYIFL